MVTRKRWGADGRMVFLRILIKESEFLTYEGSVGVSQAREPWVWSRALTADMLVFATFVMTLPIVEVLTDVLC